MHQGSTPTPRNTARTVLACSQKRACTERKSLPCLSKFLKSQCLAYPQNTSHYRAYFENLMPCMLEGQVGQRVKHHRVAPPRD
jgi:hypothetical protein